MGNTVYPLQCSITAAASVSYEHNNREVRPDRPRPSRGNVPPTLIQEILELQSEPAQVGDPLKRADRLQRKEYGVQMT